MLMFQEKEMAMDSESLQTDKCTHTIDLWELPAFLEPSWVIPGTICTLTVRWQTPGAANLEGQILVQAVPTLQVPFPHFSQLLRRAVAWDPPPVLGERGTVLEHSGHLWSETELKHKADSMIVCQGSVLQLRPQPSVQLLLHHSLLIRRMALKS